MVIRFAADSCNHLQPLAAACSHLQPQAATSSPKQPLAATCNHLQPLAQAATRSHLQPLAATRRHLPRSHLQHAATCSHLRQLADWQFEQVAAEVAASGCLSKWLQAAASDCFFENQNEARLLALWVNR